MSDLEFYNQNQYRAQNTYTPPKTSSLVNFVVKLSGNRLNTAQASSVLFFTALAILLISLFVMFNDPETPDNLKGVQSHTRIQDRGYVSPQ